MLFVVIGDFGGGLTGGGGSKEPEVLELLAGLAESEEALERQKRRAEDGLSLGDLQDRQRKLEQDLEAARSFGSSPWCVPPFP